jgi:phosphoglycerate dehydrogenase-like enzyme
MKDGPMKICIGALTIDQCREAVTDALRGEELIRLENDGTLVGAEPDEVEVFFRSPELNVVARHSSGIREALAALMGGRSLRWVQSGSAGVESRDFHALLMRGIRLTNAAGIHAEPIAQYVLMQMLNRIKRTRAHFELQAEHRWESIGGGELTGLTVGIVGFGGIGRAVARLAKAFSMRVVASKRTRVDDPTLDRLYPPSQLGALLAESDFVVLAAPQNEQTRGMIDTAALERMKPKALLINVARGGLVDEEALVDALRRKRIGGAVLDVTFTEPLPETSPLWDLPNCVITPHDSGFSPLSLERALDLFLDNLDRFQKGEPLRNEVRADR